jgi:hypothetical protein
MFEFALKVFGFWDPATESDDTSYQIPIAVVGIQPFAHDFGHRNRILELLTKIWPTKRDSGHYNILDSSKSCQNLAMHFAPDSDPVAGIWQQ